MSNRLGDPNIYAPVNQPAARGDRLRDDGEPKPPRLTKDEIVTIETMAARGVAERAIARVDLIRFPRQSV